MVTSSLRTHHRRGFRGLESRQDPSALCSSHTSHTPETAREQKPATGLMAQVTRMCKPPKRGGEVRGRRGAGRTGSCSRGHGRGGGRGWGLGGYGPEEEKSDSLQRRGNEPQGNAPEGNVSRPGRVQVGAGLLGRMRGSFSGQSWSGGLLPTPSGWVGAAGKSSD